VHQINLKRTKLVPLNLVKSPQNKVDGPKKSTSGS